MKDINAQLEKARQNVSALQSQLNEVQNKAASTNTMLTKWTGIVEYLTSLIKEDEDKGFKDGRKDADVVSIPIIGQGSAHSGGDDNGH